MRRSRDDRRWHGTDRRRMRASSGSIGHSGGGRARCGRCGVGNQRTEKRRGNGSPMVSLVDSAPSMWESGLVL